jgi:hypothetical protein
VDAPFVVELAVVTRLDAVPPEPVELDELPPHDDNATTTTTEAASASVRAAGYLILHVRIIDTSQDMSPRVGHHARRASRQLPLAAYITAH